MAKKAKAEGQKSAGEKRAEARRVNRDARDRLVAMTNQQLKGFFSGFLTEDLGRIEKAISRVRNELRDQELQAIEKQIEELKAKQKKLAGG